MEAFSIYNIKSNEKRLKTYHENKTIVTCNQPWGKRNVFNLHLKVSIDAHLRNCSGSEFQTYFILTLNLLELASLWFNSNI